MPKKFHDPIAYKLRSVSATKTDGLPAVATFDAPTKEGATTGRFMSAGDNYGVGFRTPVGTEKVSNKSPIPQHSFCASPDGFIR